MSKLVFPDRGGVLVNDSAKVVLTQKFKTDRGSYTIKIVKYPSHFKPYGYHYLDPDGNVTGSNSGNSHDVDECLQKAERSIQEVEERAAEAQRDAGRSPSEKEEADIRRRAAFFHKHAGYSYGPGQTPEQGRDENARRLALAEIFGEEAGWTVEWDYDQEEYQLGDAEESPPSEVMVAILRDADGNVIGSLGGIGDPTPAYRRVVEAELVREAMTEQHIG
jgi:hypothetical protein